MKYGDLDALKSSIRDIRPMVPSVVLGRRTALMAALDDYRRQVLDAVDASPELELEPVVHAHWIKEDEDDNSYFCSACGALWMFIEGGPKENGAERCIHCGAHMDEEV